MATVSDLLEHFDPDNSDNDQMRVVVRIVDGVDDRFYDIDKDSVRWDWPDRMVTIIADRDITDELDDELDGDEVGDEE